MTEKGKEFINAISADESNKKLLEEKLEGLDITAAMTATVEFAKSNGYDLTEGDLAAESDFEVDDNELAAVSGGGGCGCAFAGGGGGDGLICSCAPGGNGSVFSDPCTTNGYALPISQGACICPFVGAGATNRH